MKECIHAMDPAWCGHCRPKDSMAATSRSTPSSAPTKQDVLDEICEQLGVRRYPVGVGSSSPSEVFDAIPRYVAASTYESAQCPASVRPAPVSLACLGTPSMTATERSPAEDRPSPWPGSNRSAAPWHDCSSCFLIVGAHASAHAWFVASRGSEPIRALVSTRPGRRATS